jgi:hypothetical protein
MKKEFTYPDANIIKTSDGSVGICSNYVDGKCSEEPNKYCDGCATKYIKKEGE